NDHVNARMPAYVIRLANSLSGEFWRAGVEENVGSGALQSDHLRIDRGVGDLKTCRCHDHARRFRSEAHPENPRDTLFPSRHFDTEWRPSRWDEFAPRNAPTHQPRP